MENKLKSAANIRFPANSRNNKQAYQAYKSTNDVSKQHHHHQLPFPVGNNGLGIGLYAPNDIGKNILQNYHIMQDHVRRAH